METLNILAHDPKFWAALLALANVVLYFFMPTFPPTIWAAIDALALVVFGALSAKTTVVAKRKRAAAREQQA
jgi:hypothetical protein